MPQAGDLDPGLAGIPPRFRTASVRSCTPLTGVSRADTHARDVPLNLS